MRSITLNDGTEMPVLGMGTWRMGEGVWRRAAEVRALRAGLDLGLTLIDTAEMYGDGGAERVVAKAIAGRREQVFLVSKVYPHNASARAAVAACEFSLGRLHTDYLDLYLLHWPGDVPVAETVATFERLKRDGKIRRWGISNFETPGMDEVLAVEGGAACACNQVLYNPGARGIEWDLLPDCRARGLALMAYSPLGQGAILNDPGLREVADRHGVTPAAVSLAWCLRHPGVTVIPKAVDPGHLRANLRALELSLDAADLARLDAAFPPPRGPEPLRMI